MALLKHDVGCDVTYEHMLTYAVKNLALNGRKKHKDGDTKECKAFRTSTQASPSEELFQSISCILLSSLKMTKFLKMKKPKDRKSPKGRKQ